MKTLEAKPFDQNAENWKWENRLFTWTVLVAGASANRHARRLVRQGCERQKCERHQCEANSANANSAKGSTVRRDKSANVNSANASSAMPHRCEKSATAVRMTTVRKRHCSCAVTCFTGKSPSSGIVKATFLPLCNPFPNHNLTEMPLPKPSNPHPNPRTKTGWRVIRIDFHGLFFDDLLGSVTLPLS